MPACCRGLRWSAGDEIEKFRLDLCRRGISAREGIPRGPGIVRAIRADGKRVALASSAKAEELANYKRIAGIEDLVDAETSSDDAERSKPHPDIFQAALDRLGASDPAEAIAVGDTPYDAESAGKAGLRTVGLLCGGWPEEELLKAGCIAIFRDPADLLRQYDRSPLADGRGERRGLDSSEGKSRGSHRGNRISISADRGRIPTSGASIRPPPAPEGVAIHVPERRSCPMSLPPARIASPIADVETPAILIDLDAYERNLDRMVDSLEGHPVRLRAHAKTHKCPIIANHQVSRGAVGICCQTLGEAEAMVLGGMRNILITNQIVSPGKLRRLAALSKQAEVMVCVDDEANLQDLEAAAHVFNVRLPVLVEVNIGQNRCGVEPGAPTLALARSVAAWPGLRFAGIQAYHGKAQHIYEPGRRAEVMGAAVSLVRQSVEPAARARPGVRAGERRGDRNLSHRGGQRRLQRGPGRLLHLHGRRLSEGPG